MLDHNHLTTSPPGMSLFPAQIILQSINLILAQYWQPTRLLINHFIFPNAYSASWNFIVQEILRMGQFQR